MASPLVSVILKFMILIAFGNDHPINIEHVTVNVYPVEGSASEVIISVPDLEYIDNAHEAAFMVHRGIDVADIETALKDQHDLCFDYDNKTVQNIELKRSGPTGIRVAPAEGIVKHDSISWLPPRNIIQIHDATPGPDGQQLMTGLIGFNMTVPVVSC